jgi:hypothetical protein
MLMGIGMDSHDVYETLDTKFSDKMAKYESWMDGLQAKVAKLEAKYVDGNFMTGIEARIAKFEQVVAAQGAK